MNYFRILLSVFLPSVFLLSPSFVFAQFDQTSGTKTDAAKFGGMSDEEVEQELANEMKKMQNEYLRAVYERVKKFDDGAKSSKFGNQAKGYYSGYGEAHMVQGDGMVSHEGGSNAVEGAIEGGALGTTGLTGQARVDAEKKEMEKATTALKPVEGVAPAVDPKTKEAYTHRNNTTGQLQTRSFEISAALQDGGAAHGDANDTHRVYVLKKEVRDAAKTNAEKYGKAIIDAATAGPGVQMNFDLAHKAYSKLEQDKYIMMASDALAFKAARYSDVDTTDSSSRPTVGEFKQIAIDAYARNPGNVEKAETEIKELFAGRIAEKKVVSSKKIGDIERANQPPNAAAPPSDEKTMSLKAAADEILAKLGTSADGAKSYAIQQKIKNSFYDSATEKYIDAKVSPTELMSNFTLSELSGIVAREKMDDLYKQAQQKLDAGEAQKITEYKARLAANKCLNFETMCVAKTSLIPSAAQAQSSAGDKSLIDKDMFRDVASVPGLDPGAVFTDTRELIFNQFAYAYNKPLAEWKKLVTNADFSSTMNNAKGREQYAEFDKMYQTAMQGAQDIRTKVDESFINRLRSGGATEAQLARIQRNYGAGGKNDFDARRKSFMELYGQNKDRDAVAMAWRKRNGQTGLAPNPNYSNPALNKPMTVNQALPKAQKAGGPALQ